MHSGDGLGGPLVPPHGLHATTRFFDNHRRRPGKPYVAGAQLYEPFVELRRYEHSCRGPKRRGRRGLILKDTQVVHVAPTVATAFPEVDDAEQHRVPRHAGRATRLRHTRALLLARERDRGSRKLAHRCREPLLGTEAFEPSLSVIAHGASTIPAMLEVRMTTDAGVRLFAHLAARPEADVDLLRVALLLAEPDYPGLDIGAYLDRIDELGALARVRVVGPRPSARSSAPPKVAALLSLLYDEIGFHGDTEDFYDPRNSFINEVLDRRVGIPITLALVVVEVSRRAGVEAHGVGFPGHFLVRFDGDAGSQTLVDPFDGRVLDEPALTELANRHTGRPLPQNARALEPASKANTLIRMLNNLRGIYAAREDHTRLRLVLERLEVLAPSTELRRQIEALGGAHTPPPRTRAPHMH